MALYRRYRPSKFQDVIGQEQVTKPLMAALRGDRTAHAYLFSGPRGCGKTTSARIMARCLNCVEAPTDTPCGVCESCVELSLNGSGSLDVVEMAAASHGGVDDARELVERASFAPARDRYKIFIIDEAHMVTNQGFNALLKLVEEPPPHVKFIFATTEPEKVIGTIRSRTHHYPFRLVPPEILESFLAGIAEEEGTDIGPGVLPLVVRAGGGSVRDSLSVLDQLIGGVDSGQLRYDDAIALLGYTDVSLLDDATEAIAASDGATLFSVVDRMVQSGHDPRRFVEDLLQRLRDLIVISLAGSSATDVFGSVPADQFARMEAQAEHMGAARASHCADLVNDALSAMVGATSPRLQLELLCARLLLPANAPQVVAAGVSNDAQPEPRRAREVPGAEHRAAAAGQRPAGAAQRPAVVQRPTAPAPTRRPNLAELAGTASESPKRVAESSGIEEAREVTVVAQPDMTQPDTAQQPDIAQPATENTEVSALISPRDGVEGEPRSTDGAPGEAPVAQAETAEKTETAVQDAGSAVTKAGGGQVAPVEKSVNTEAVPVEAGTGAFSSVPAQNEGKRSQAMSSEATSSSDTPMIRQRWSEVVASMQVPGSRATASIVSNNVQIGSFSEGVLTLIFDSNGLATTFNERGHGPRVEAALRDVLGIDATVVGTAGGGGVPSPKASAVHEAASQSPTGSNPSAIERASTVPHHEPPVSGSGSLASGNSSLASGSGSPSVSSNRAPSISNDVARSPVNEAQVSVNTVPVPANEAQSPVNEASVPHEEPEYRVPVAEDLPPLPEPWDEPPLEESEESFPPHPASLPPVRDGQSAADPAGVLAQLLADPHAGFPSADTSHGNVREPLGEGTELPAEFGEGVVEPGTGRVEPGARVVEPGVGPAEPSMSAALQEDRAMGGGSVLEDRSAAPVSAEQVAVDAPIPSAPSDEPFYAQRMPMPRKFTPSARTAPADDSMDAITKRILSSHRSNEAVSRETPATPAESSVTPEYTSEEDEVSIDDPTIEQSGIVGLDVVIDTFEGVVIEEVAIERREF